ncbi:MAG: RIP metalloprotease RseP [bacterium]|jgi:regulator of sigma E protease|nr:RIP metalloprotease RseP [bacterium]
MPILSAIGNILIFLLVLSIVIVLHELGHFYFARKAGILCHEFAFGMGPRLWSKKVGETTYSIRAIPFGGFVAMAGEEVESSLIRKGDKVRLHLDNDGFVDKIIVDVSHPNYLDCPVEVVEIIDLLGKDNSPLYINHFPVRRNAYYVFLKKELQIAPYERNFNSKTKMQRFLTTVAGPMMNVILAFVVLLFSALVYGVANFDSTVLGAVSENLPVSEYLLPGDKVIEINGVEVHGWSSNNTSISTIQTELAKPSSDGYIFTILRTGEVLSVGPIYKTYTFYGLGFSSSPGETELIIRQPVYQAMLGVLLPGDKIISINGETFDTWAELVVFANAYTSGSSKEEPAVIVVERSGVQLDPIEFTAYGVGVLPAIGVPSLVTSAIGIGPSNKFSIVGSLGEAGTQMVAYSTTIFSTLRQLFVKSQVQVDDLGGFIAIFQATSQAANQGLRTLLNWVALLSVNLAILNLLPIPALDGGRIAFIGYEAVTGKKPNQRFENFLHMIVFFLLIGLMLFVTYNDILRLFGLK